MHIGELKRFTAARIQHHLRKEMPTFSAAEETRFSLVGVKRFTAAWKANVKIIAGFTNAADTRKQLHHCHTFKGTSPRTTTQHRIIKEWAKPHKGKAASNPNRSNQQHHRRHNQRGERAHNKRSEKPSRGALLFLVLRVSSMSTASSMRKCPEPTVAQTQHLSRGDIPDQRLKHDS